MSFFLHRIIPIGISWYACWTRLRDGDVSKTVSQGGGICSGGFAPRSIQKEKQRDPWAFSLYSHFRLCLCIDSISSSPWWCSKSREFVFKLWWGRWVGGGGSFVCVPIAWITTPSPTGTNSFFYLHSSLQVLVPDNNN